MHRLSSQSPTLQPSRTDYSWLLEWERQRGEMHWRTSLERNMLRNKDIPDHRGNCKLRQTIGRQLQWGLSCVSPQAGDFPLLVYCTYRQVQSTHPQQKKTAQLQLYLSSQTGQGQNLLWKSEWAGKARDISFSCDIRENASGRSTK